MTKCSIEIAEHSGFCFGVERAIQMALQALKEYENVVTLGPIIHNPQMVQYLQKKGLGCVNSIEEITDQVVIIRSHGITNENYKKLQEKNVIIIDATCPIVKKAQNFAKKLTAKDYQLVILGEKAHPEVEALLSYVDDKSIVVDNPNEKLELDDMKIALIAQTTQSEETFELLGFKLLKMCRELHVVKTICNATKLRQEETRMIAKKVDIMFIVGGKNSANTTRLAEIARQERCESFHIETADEIHNKMFRSNQKVGICAGASTPAWIINNVKNKINKYLCEDNLNV